MDIDGIKKREILNLLRHRKNLTIKGVAKSAKIPHWKLSLFCSGSLDEKSFTKEEKSRISNVLNTPLEILFDEDF